MLTGIALCEMLEIQYGNKVGRLSLYGMIQFCDGMPSLAELWAEIMLIAFIPRLLLSKSNVKESISYVMYFKDHMQMIECRPIP